MYVFALCALVARVALTLDSQEAGAGPGATGLLGRGAGKLARVGKGRVRGGAGAGAGMGRGEAGMGAGLNASTV